MRKLGLLPVLAGLVLTGTPLQGQGIVVGPKVGATYSGLASTEEGFETTQKASFVVGGFLGINPSGGVLIFGGELLYASHKIESVGETLTQNRIELPVYVGAQFGSGTVHPRIYGGGAVAFEASCNLSEAGESISCTDAGGETKSTQFDVLGGAGIGVAVGSIILDFDVRGTYGLTKLIEDDDSRLWSIYWMVGIGIPLGG